MTTVKVNRTNPSLEIEVDDELVLKLFTDVAGCKAAIRLLGGFMFAGFSIMSGLIIVL